MSRRSDDFVRASARMQVTTFRRFASVNNDLDGQLDGVETASDLSGMAQWLGNQLDGSMNELVIERARGLARAWNQAHEQRVFSYPKEVNVSGVFGDLQGSEALQAAERIARSKLTAGDEPVDALRPLRNALRTATRTAASAVNNAAALAVMSTAPGVAGVAAVVILDDRTSEICLGLSGGMWDAETGEPLDGSAVEEPWPGPPPYHWNCRTTLAPIMQGHLRPQLDSLESWYEENPDEVRATLGADKVALWQRGLLPLPHLVDQSSRPIDDMDAAAGEDVLARVAGSLEPRAVGRQ